MVTKVKPSTWKIDVQIITLWRKGFSAKEITAQLMLVNTTRVYNGLRRGKTELQKITKNKCRQ